MIPRKALILIIILLLISPLFGVVLADMVGYHEPLDIAAEALGLSDISEEVNWTPFFDYTFPGLDPITGYILSGLIGIAIIIAIGWLMHRLVSGRKV